MQRTWQKTRSTAGIRRMLGCIWDARGACPCRDGSWRRFEGDPGAALPPGAGAVMRSGRDSGGLSAPVLVEREAVDHEGVAEQVVLLAFVALAVGASEPEAVVNRHLDGVESR